MSSEIEVYLKTHLMRSTHRIYCHLMAFTNPSLDNNYSSSFSSFRVKMQKMRWISSTHSQHPGPIPTFQNQYGCIQEAVYYSANLTSLRAHHGVMSGNLTNSPCGKGNYSITAIAHTKSILTRSRGLPEYRRSF